MLPQFPRLKILVIRGLYQTMRRRQYTFPVERCASARPVIERLESLVADSSSLFEGISTFLQRGKHIIYLFRDPLYSNSFDRVPAVASLSLDVSPSNLLVPLFQVQILRTLGISTSWPNVQSPFSPRRSRRTPR